MPGLQLRSVYVALVMVQVFFATLPVAVKIALRDLSSPAIALLRVAGAAALFVALQRALSGERVREVRDFALLAVYSLFGVVLNQLLYITALTYTTATAAQTVMAAGPAITLLVAIVARRETATPLKWAGIAMAGAGALVLIGGGGRGGAFGNFLALLNVAAYSVYMVISRDMLRRYQPLTVITWVFVFGVIGILPWGAAPVVREAGAASGATWAALLYIVLFPTVGSYYLHISALRRVEASVVAVFIYLQPVMTALLAIPILHERISPRLLPAALLIFAGVAATVAAGRRERRRSGEPPDAAREDGERVA
jgi:drug/metabolite transporter (DMT)-like permease